MSNVTWEIKQHIAKISKPDKNGWAKELNFVSWNGRDPTYDLRAWSSDHSSCSKGISLSKLDLQVLKAVLNGSNPIAEIEQNKQVEEVGRAQSIEKPITPMEDTKAEQSVEQSTAFQQPSVSDLFADEDSDDQVAVKEVVQEVQSGVEILEAPTVVDGVLDFSNFKFREVEVG